MAKLPERVVSKEGKNRLRSQLTGQNRRSLFFLGLEMGLKSLGPALLCVVLLVHANRSDTSDRGLGLWSRTPKTTGPKPRLNPASGGSYGIWDHSPCVWFCLCGPIEATLPTGVWDHRFPTGVWDQQRSRCEARGCEACRCEACRCEARRCEACRCEARNQSEGG